MQDGSRDLPKRLRADRNRALADANLGELRWQLQSKAAWYGVTVVVAEPHGATGRTCSECGAVKTKPLPPAEEQFRCLFCGYTASRRLNTARLMASVARSHHDASSAGESLNARRDPVRPTAPRGSGRGSVKREARSRPVTAEIRRAAPVGNGRASPQPTDGAADQAPNPGQ
jgi:putative transposase